MKIPLWIQDLAFSFLDQDYILEHTNWDEEVNKLKNAVIDKEKSIVDLQNIQQEIMASTAKLLIENEELKKLPLFGKEQTELDKFCHARYTEIPKIAYTQKRSFLGKYYTISLHELIVYDSWIIWDFLKNTDRQSGTIKDIATRIGDKIAGYLIWTDDKNLDKSGDYYLSPAETLTYRRADCEDHCFVVCSCHLEFGGAWGFYGDIGHAFNVFVMDDKLYVLDTVEDVAHIEEFTPNNKYKIYYIITKNYAYMVKGGKTFGILAGWDD